MRTSKVVAGCTLAMSCVAGLALAEGTKAPAPTTVAAPAADIVTVNMETSVGTIVLALNKTKAPNTVANFVQYANDGTLNGTIFHRVIQDFMIQGGGFTKDYRKVATRDAIRSESMNGLKNNKYTIAMARTPDPHSATNQFFINTGSDNSNLDYRPGIAWGYTVFGKVVKGFKVVDKISKVPTGAGGRFSQDAPLTPIVIKSVSVVK